MEMEAQNITALYPNLLAEIIFGGTEVESRGMKVRELRNFTFVLHEVSQPLVLQKERKLNYAYAILEPFLLTMPQTYAVVEACEFYVGEFLKKHVIDQRTEKMFGFYGDKLNWNGRNQLIEVFEILRADPGSRRAVITIHDSKQELFADTDSRDIPCTLELQFMIRNKKLECYVNMRGNDAMLGTPQNVPMWTFFQRMLARWLDIPTGKYFHHVNSMHIYMRDLEKAEAIIRNKEGLNTQYDTPLTWEINNPITSLQMCEKFAENERSYRQTGSTNHAMPSFLGRLAEKVIFPRIDRKKKGEAVRKSQNPYAVIDS